MLPIRLRGACTHNLRGVDLDLEPGRLVALTGPSGAGKSSLALDTLYAEGQRRFVESFSPYARQFLERLERPPVGSLEPIAATVAVDRRAPVKSSRSTVATLTDMEPYLAALFACEAVPTCPDCNEPATATTAHDAATRAVERVRRAPRDRQLPACASRSAESYLEVREALVARRLSPPRRGRQRPRDRRREAERGGPARRRRRGGRRSLEARRARRAKAPAGDRDRLGARPWSRRAAHGRCRADRREPDFHGSGREDAAARRHRARARVPELRASRSSRRAPASSRTTRRSARAPTAAASVASSPSTGTRSSRTRRRRSRNGCIKAWSGKSSEWEREVLVKFAKKRKIPLDVAVGEAHRGAARRGHRRRRRLGGRQVPGHQGLVQVARGPHVQDARARLPLALSRLRPVRRVQRRAPQRDGAHVPRRRARPRRLARRSPSRRHASASTTIASQRRAGQAREERARARGSRISTPSGSRISRSIARRARSPAARRSARASRPRSARRSPARSSCSTSRPSGLHATDVPRLADAMRDLAKAGNTVLVIEHDRGDRRALRSRRRDGTGRGAARRQHPLLRNAGRARDERRPPTGRARGAKSGRTRHRARRARTGRAEPGMRSRDHRRAREQPARSIASRSRSGCCAPSPAPAAPARARSPRTSSIAPSRARCGDGGTEAGRASTRMKGARAIRRARCSSISRRSDAPRAEMLQPTRMRGTACARGSPPSPRRCVAGLSARVTSRSTCPARDAARRAPARATRRSRCSSSPT